jgi:hypothetical protein
VDATGDVVVMGVFVGTEDFGTGPLQALGENGSLYVAKYDCAGTPKWIKTFGKAAAIDFLSGAITTDPQNAVLITGRFNEPSVDFGCGPLQGGSTGFVAKLDAGGACVWSKGFDGASGLSWPESIAADAAGSVFVAGEFKGTSDFGGGPVSGGPVKSQLADVFLLKLDQAGNFGWFKDFGSEQGGAIKMARDAEGNFVFCGQSKNGGLNFGGGPLPASGLILAKVDATGSYVWDKSLSAPYATCSGIATNAGGDLLVGGWYDGQPDLGGGPLPAGASQGAFALGYSSAGGFLFSKGSPGGLAAVSAVGVSTAGNGAFVGSFFDALTLGGPALMTTSGGDVFVLELTPSGTFVSAKQFGGASMSDSATAMAVAGTPAGMLVLSGQYQGAIDFGNGPLPVSSISGGFVAQIAP